MASVRNLKKNLNYLTRELITESLTFKHFHPEVKPEDFDKAVKGIIDNHNDLIVRCGNYEREADRKATRAHFRAICSDFEKSLSALDNLNKE